MLTVLYFDLQKDIIKRAGSGVESPKVRGSPLVQSYASESNCLSHQGNKKRLIPRDC